jgi:sigma-B regulation protein RsbU (phosphoserine phosphatase)
LSAASRTVSRLQAARIRTAITAPIPQAAAYAVASQRWAIQGIPAALFMAVATTPIRILARCLKTSEEIVRQVSDALAAHNPQNLFVTLFCAVFDPEAGKVSYANAGHPSPVLLRACGVPSMPLPSSAMMAGVFPGMEVGARTLELRPGDTLVLYTDGVTEAFNAERATFAEDRLLELLTREPGGNATAAVASVLSALRRHAAGQPQSDDITIVAVRYCQ